MPLTTEQRDKSIREIRDASIQAAGSAAATAAPRVVPAIRDRVQTIRANQAERRIATPSQAPEILSASEARQRAFDTTERQAAENYRRYRESGGFEGQLQRELAETQARNARNAQAAAEQAAQNAINANSARQAQLAEEAKRLRFNEQLEALGRDWANNPDKYQTEIRNARQQTDDLLKNAANNRAASQAAELDRQLTRQARELQQLELNETNRARRTSQELADSIARNQISRNEISANRLLDDWRVQQDFRRIQQQQLTRQTAKNLGYPVSSIEAAELARLRRPATLDLLPDNRPARSIGKDATEGVSKEPFTNRPKPSYPTKPPIQERSPRLPDTFHPIELKVKERVRFNPLDLRPIPSDLQNGLTNKTKTLLPHRPLPSNLNPALPKPWFPGFPRTNFPIRLPKGTKGNVLLDLAFDLIFPDPLNNGEDEKLREIAERKKDEFRPFEYPTLPNTRYLPYIVKHTSRIQAEEILYPGYPKGYFGKEWTGDWLGGWVPGEILGYLRTQYKTNTGRNNQTGVTASWSGYYEHFIVSSNDIFSTIAVGGQDLFDIAYIAALLPEGSPLPNIDPNTGKTPLPDDGIDLIFVPGNGYPFEFKPVPGKPRKPDWRPKNTPNAPFKPWDDPSRPKEMEPSPEFQPSPDSDPNRQPLPPFQRFEQPKRRTQTEEQHEKECEGGGDCMTCRFNIAAIRAVVQEEINKQLASNTTVEIYDDNTGKIEKKPMAVLSLGSTADAVKLVYSELAKVREQKPVATVPDRFKTRVPDDRPQMVIVYADSKNKSYYQLVVPWAKNAKPVASKWKKGSKMVILELRDNSKIVVNAINEAEGNRVINQLKASIPADKLRDSKITTSCRKDKLKEIDVTPIRADWYERGLAQDTPTKRYYYA